MATYTAISRMNGNELANAASELAVAKDPEFERGAENATTYFLYCHGMLKDGDDKRGLVRKATEKAKTTSRDAITATMLTEIWINEVKRVEAKYNR